MAKGLVACATYHSGIPELIEDGVTGYLVPESDVAALSDKIHYVINNRGNWSQITGKGYKKVSREYSIQILNDRLESLLEACTRDSTVQ